VLILILSGQGGKDQVVMQNRIQKEYHIKKNIEVKADERNSN